MRSTNVAENGRKCDYMLNFWSSIRYTDVDNNDSNKTFRAYLTENARPENAGLDNDGQHFSKRWAKLRGLENARLENDGPCYSALMFFTIF